MKRNYMNFIFVTPIIINLFYTPPKFIIAINIFIGIIISIYIICLFLRIYNI